MKPELHPNPNATTHFLSPVAVLTLIAAALRLYHLEIPSMWWDEILVPLNAATPIGDILLRAKTDDFHPPAFYLLIKLVLAAGDSDFALRLPSVAAGTATVPLLYFLAAPRLGRTAALFAAAILAVGGPMILLSRQVRPYSLIIFLSLLAAKYLLDWCERPRLKTVAALTLATCCYVFLHYLSVLILAVQGWGAAMTVLRHRSARSLVQLTPYAAGSAAALAATWCFFHSSPSSLTQGSMADTALLGLDKLVSIFMGVGSNPFARVFLLALIGIGTALMARRNRRLAVLGLATVAGPVVLLSLARYNSYFNPWHLSFATPFLCLMAGTCLDVLFRSARPASALAIGLALVGAGALLYSGRERYYTPQSHTGFYKQQARELPQALRSGALLASSELSELDAIDWYASRFAVPDPLRRRAVAVGDEVAVDFVSFGQYGHLAKNSGEFLAHFDALHGNTTISGGIVHHLAMRHDPPRIGETLPWHDTLDMTPWAVARQCDDIIGASLDVYFGGSLLPETGGAPGSILYGVKSSNYLPQPLFLRLMVPYSNPVPGNVVRFTYSLDGEPETVAFESHGNEPEALRVVIVRLEKLFSCLKFQVTLEPNVTHATMTGNYGALVRLKSMTLYANAIANEVLGSSSLYLQEEGIGPVEREGFGQWRWALGEQTALRFTLPKDMAVTADFALNNPIAGQSVTIVFNGQPLEVIDGLAPDKWLSPTVSRQLRLVGRQGENTLSLRFAAWNGQANRPAATFAPGDGRPFAVAFTKLRLELDNPAKVHVY